MTLYVVRHGETNENIHQIMQGNMDTLLNEHGQAEAREVRESLQDVKIDLIIASPMTRTKETAEIISNGQVPIIYDKRLLSRDHGEFQGMSRNEVNLEEYWNLKEDHQYEKAESVGQMYNRLASLLEEIERKYYNQTVLLVTHSGPCRILYYYFNGIPENGDLMAYESTNCSIEKYTLGEVVL